MRLTRMRFTIRHLMVAVVILAVVLGIVVGLRRRRQSFERRARMVAQKASDVIMAEQIYRMARRGSGFGYNARTTTAHYELVEHYSALREKYDKAAARPWLLVAPDRSEPAWPKDAPNVAQWTSGR
jgi:hypothetical protein